MNNIYYFTATKNCLNYVKDGGFFGGVTHSIRRNHVFDDIIELYESNPSIVKEFPFTVKFKDERLLMQVELQGMHYQHFGSMHISPCLMEDHF